MIPFHILPFFLFQGIVKTEDPEKLPKTNKMQDSTPETKALIPPQSISVVRTESPSKKSKNDLFPRIAAALFYGIASFMIMVVNKHVLTIHKFPSFQVRFLKENTVELGYKRTC